MNVKVETYGSEGEAAMCAARYKKRGNANVVVIGPLDTIEINNDRVDGWLVLATDAELQVAGNP